MANYRHPILLVPADRPKLSRLIAFVLGAATTLAFAPYSLSFLAPLLVLPLLFVCLSVAPRDAAAHAFWYGFGLFLTGTYWIYISVHIFGNAARWIALLLMVGLYSLERREKLRDRLLSTVLEGVEPQEGHLRGTLHAGDADHPALLAWPVVQHGERDVRGCAGGVLAHSSSAVRVWSIREGMPVV